MSWTHSLVFPIVLIGTIFTALDGAAQNPKPRRTDGANL
jgi:hypothetical protein